MVITALLIAPNGKLPQCVSGTEGTKCGTSHRRLLLSGTTEWTSDTQDNLEESPENYAEWEKKPILNGHILCDSVYTTFLRRRVCNVGEQTGGCWEGVAVTGQQEGSCYGKVVLTVSMSVLWM